MRQEQILRLRTNLAINLWITQKKNRSSRCSVVVKIPRYASVFRFVETGVCSRLVSVPQQAPARLARLTDTVAPGESTVDPLLLPANPHIPPHARHRRLDATGAFRILSVDSKTDAAQ